MWIPEQVGIKDNGMAETASKLLLHTFSILNKKTYIKYNKKEAKECCETQLATILPLLQTIQ